MIEVIDYSQNISLIIIIKLLKHTEKEEKLVKLRQSYRNQKKVDKETR